MFIWLCGDILLKVDKMIMVNLLEFCVLFLDKEVFDVVFKILIEFKIVNGIMKVILCEVVCGIVLDYVLDCKKFGFLVLICYWLKDEMYDWVINIINESKIEYLIDK